MKTIGYRAQGTGHRAQGSELHFSIACSDHLAKYQRMSDELKQN
jgi:hypothetical protein